MIGEQGHRPGLLAARGGGTASLFCSRNGTLSTVAKWGALLKAGGVLGSLQTLGGKTLASVYIDDALYYSWALGHTPRDAGAGTGGPDLLGALTVCQDYHYRDTDINNHRTSPRPRAVLLCIIIPTVPVVAAFCQFWSEEKRKKG